jgi:hypothetical protein
VVQFLARKTSTNWLPRLAIDPSSVIALPVRSQTCCAMAGVSRASFGWPMSVSVCWTSVSDTR